MHVLQIILLCPNLKNKKHLHTLKEKWERGWITHSHLVKMVLSAHITPTTTKQPACKNTSPRTFITYHVKTINKHITLFISIHKFLNHINISHLITISNIINNMTLTLAITSKCRMPPWACQPVYELWRDAMSWSSVRLHTINIYT